MQRQRPAAHGDQTCAGPQPATALSLKARETAALSLKRIFEQRLQLHNIVNDHHQFLQHTTVNDRHQFVDLDLRLGAAPASSTDSTFNFNSINRSGNAETSNSSMSCKAAQLTAFYAGNVYVFDDVPSDKAQAILRLAAGSARDQSASARGYTSTVNAAAACKSRPTTPDILSSRPPIKPRARSHTELPFARKVSLARFLERRKDRVETKVGEAEMSNAKDGDEMPTEPPQKRRCTKSSLPSTNL